MTNSNESQNISKVSLKLPENIFRDFRLALTLRNETAQDVLYRAALEYIKETPLPNDTLLGKQ